MSTSSPPLSLILPEPTLPLTPLGLLFVEGVIEPRWEIKWSVISPQLLQSLGIIGHRGTPSWKHVFWLALRRPLQTVSLASRLLVSLLLPSHPPDVIQTGTPRYSVLRCSS